jgi:hypothetical protein
MKKSVTLTLIVALIMTLVCFAGFSAAAEFTAPDYEPADTTRDIGLMLANNIDYEGVTGIQTTGTFNSAWRVAVLFELDEETGAYKAVAVHAGGPTGPDWTIGENQFVVENNSGNNWPVITAAPVGDEWWYGGKNFQDVPYDECPNFINDKNQAWGAVLKSVQVGDLFILVGIDLSDPQIIANYAVDPNYDYITHNAEYATYSYLTPYGVEDVDYGIAVGKSYTKLGQYADPSTGVISYPDTDDSELTDGVIPTDPGYGNPQLTGFNANSPEYQAGGYAEVVLDLEEVVAISRINVVTSNLMNAGIAAPAEFKYFISEDNADWTEVGVGTYDVDPTEKDGETNVNGNKMVNNSIDVEGSARYVKVQFKNLTGNAWMFLGEIQVFGADEPGDESSEEESSEEESSTAPAESSAVASSEEDESSTGGSTPTGDTGYVALAVVAVIALAGAVVIRKRK